MFSIVGRSCDRVAWSAVGSQSKDGGTLTAWLPLRTQQEGRVGWGARVGTLGVAVDWPLSRGRLVVYRGQQALKRNPTSTDEINDLTSMIGYYWWLSFEEESLQSINKGGIWLMGGVRRYFVLKHKLNPPPLRLWRLQKLHNPLAYHDFSFVRVLFFVFAFFYPVFCPVSISFPCEVLSYSRLSCGGHFSPTQQEKEKNKFTHQAFSYTNSFISDPSSRQRKVRQSVIKSPPKLKILST